MLRLPELAMFTGAGLDQFWHHSRAHRLFALARWSSDAVGLELTDLIVARLPPAGSPLTVAVDDTLFKRSGKGVRGGLASRRCGEGPDPSGSATAGSLLAAAERADDRAIGDADVNLLGIRGSDGSSSRSG